MSQTTDHRPFFRSLVVAITLGAGSSAGADSLDDYQEVEAAIYAALEERYSDPDDPALSDRRQRLKALFEEVPWDLTLDLHDRLAAGDGDLGELFQYRLATATREELLGILEANFPAEAPDDEVPLPPPAPDLPPSAEESARVAREALDAVEPDAEPAAKLRCILERVERFGSRFDDSYYDVLPGPDLHGDLNSAACYKKGEWIDGVYTNVCRSGPDARKTCERRIVDGLISRVNRNESDSEIVAWLLRTEERIRLGIVHMNLIRTSGSAGASCEGLRTHIMPDVAARANASDSLYGCYD